MIKIRITTVDTVDHDVDSVVEEFDNYDDFKSYLDEESGTDEDYIDIIISDLKENKRSVFESDVWFEKYEVI